MVEDGTIGREDLVHDALTGEWAPTWAHPIYRLIRAPLVADEDDGGRRDADSVARATRSGSGSAGAPSDAGDSDGADLALDLVEAPRPSPEEEARTFLARMARERDTEAREAAEGVARDLPLVDSRSGVVSGLVEPARPAEPGASASTRQWSASRPMSSRPADGPRGHRGEAGGGSHRAAVVSGPVVAPPRARRSGAKRRRWWGAAGAGALVVGAVAALAPQALRIDRSGRAVPDVAASPVRSATLTEEGARRAARAGFLATVDDLRRDLDLVEVPDAWLEGRYLAAPSSYAGVRTFWADFLRYLEMVRERESGLYRDAYLEVLDSEGVSGAVRSLRLASASAAFEAGRAERASAYDVGLELARAALDLHDALSRMEGRITYEPARSDRRVSADPVVEAAGSDLESQAALDRRLDRVLSALHATGAEGRSSRRDVPGWLARALGELDGGGSGAG